MATITIKDGCHQVDTDLTIKPTSKAGSTADPHATPVLRRYVSPYIEYRRDLSRRTNQRRKEYKHVSVDQRRQTDRRSSSGKRLEDVMDSSRRNIDVYV